MHHKSREMNESFGTNYGLCCDLVFLDEWDKSCKMVHLYLFVFNCNFQFTVISCKMVHLYLFVFNCNFQFTVINLKCKRTNSKP